MRICIRAATHMRMFPYIFPVIRERGLPHVDPVVFFVLCTYFPPCCLESTCQFHVLSPFWSFSFFCRVAVFPKFLAKVENRKMKDHEQAV